MSNPLSYHPAPTGRVDDRRATCTPAQRVTRSLLGYGVIAGPFYVVVTLIQAAVRDGFDLRRHEWSLLANGGRMGPDHQLRAHRSDGDRRLGRPAPSVVHRPGRRSAPILIAVFGVSLIGAGVFRADPMLGFPLGTPDGPPAQISITACSTWPSAASASPA